MILHYKNCFYSTLNQQSSCIRRHFLSDGFVSSHRKFGEIIFSGTNKKILTRISSAFYKNHMIFYAQKSHDFFYSKMIILYIKLKKWLNILLKLICRERGKILKAYLASFLMLCINGLYSISYKSTL